MFSHLKGFHSRWANTVERVHPSIWVFIRKLKDEEKREKRRLNAARRGQLNVQQKRKWRLLERRIQTLRDQYNTGERQLSDFWDAISHVVKDYA